MKYNDMESLGTSTDPQEEDDHHHKSNIGRVGDVLGKSIVTVVKHTTPDAVKDVWRLARWETQNIRCWRTLIFFLLLITGAFVSSYTYVFLRREQDSDFQSNYDLFVTRIEYAIQSETESVVLATENLATTISGAAKSTNSTFPFVTQPLFEINGYTTRSESTLELGSYSPIVAESQKEQWQSYSVKEIGWIEESRAFLEGKGIESDSATSAAHPFIWETDENGNRIPSTQGPYLPLWLTTPPPAAPDLLINFNMLAASYTFDMFRAILVTREGLLSPLEDFSAQVHAIENAEPLPPLPAGTEDNVNVDVERRSVFVAPVFGDVTDTDSHIAGLVHGLFAWSSFLSDILPSDARGVFVVLKNSCNQTGTYKIKGEESVYVGHGDLHQNQWNDLEYTFTLSNIISNTSMQEEGHCVYSFSIYPSDELRDVWREITPLLFAITTAGAFFLIAMTFIVYDRYTIRRNEKMIGQAAKTNQIVQNLFPSNVRDRLLAEDEGDNVETGAQTRLKNFLDNDGPSRNDLELDDGDGFKTRPIADLFPECSVLYADIAGFTSWSSAREPNQVFTLLETIYKGFDEIAKQTGIYKVETIGDCYVACCGLPEPRVDHAIAMCHFAVDCLDRMRVLVKKLEVHLGPDTSDLAMRIGIHSGAVTAGVLRGDRSRFQLFGDTCNKAAKMESSGKRDRIQVSQETADILIAAGLGRWLTPRDDSVSMMGKGDMKTYWLKGGHAEGEFRQSSDSATKENLVQSTSVPAKVASDSEAARMPSPADALPQDERLERRVDWVSEVLLRLLRRIIAKRGPNQPKKHGRVDESVYAASDGTVLEEVQEHIALPKYDATCKLELDSDSIQLDPEVDRQVHSFVAAIASMYRENFFHNFEHATHVTMSVSKLLSRIVAPSDMDFQSSKAKNEQLHDHTYGITSDPLTQFSCVFSALIHDVEHTGVPNTVLIREDIPKAQLYKGRSVAEQNSVDLSWDLLMQDDFKAFREQIYTTQEELSRFRQLVVNSVMATDIMDKDLKKLRNSRWEKAFSERAVTDSDPTVNLHRKATIVIEHLIQASDVAHTMQHWNIYRKWNEKLFFEMYEAFLSGRADKDPSTFWYQGEIGFFDFYIIPLAKKLKNCGVFGVSSDEYLQYALRNRKEWEQRGQQMVAEYLEKFREM